MRILRAENIIPLKKKYMQIIATYSYPHQKSSKLPGLDTAERHNRVFTPISEVVVLRKGVAIVTNVGTCWVTLTSMACKGMRNFQGSGGACKERLKDFVFTVYGCLQK